MSVMVATAYMDEAERFDWLMAMDDGKIIATGTLKELLAKTGEPNLDEAFIALMPEAKRALHKKVVVRPRVASPDETPAIEAEGLTRQFGDFVAVDHVSFKIPRGEIFGFLGSNGCGKSTTMKMLVGFLPATSGTCKLFGEPMGSNDMQARRNVGYMTQAFSLYGELTVAQNLELHAQLYHLPPEKVAGRIEELLERYDLKVRRQRAPGQPAARHQATPSARRRGAARARHSHSRRADLGRRPDRARRLLANADRSLARRRRDDFRHHPFHERGGALRPHLAHARRQGARGRRAAGSRQGARQRLRSRTVLSAISPRRPGIDMSKKIERAGDAPPAEAEAGRAAEALQDWPALGLRAARDGRAAARSDPAGLRARRPDHSDARLRLRHLVRHREPGRRRPSTRTTRPRAANCCRVSRARAISRCSRRSRRPNEAERRLRSGNTQIVVEVPPGFGRDLLNDRTAGGRRDGRRRHDVPRRDGEELCQRRRPQAGRGASARSCIVPGAPTPGTTTILRPAFATIRPSSA